MADLLLALPLLRPVYQDRRAPDDPAVGVVPRRRLECEPETASVGGAVGTLVDALAPLDRLLERGQEGPVGDDVGDAAADVPRGRRAEIPSNAVLPSRNVRSVSYTTRRPASRRTASDSVARTRAAPLGLLAGGPLPTARTTRWRTVAMVAARSSSRCMSASPKASALREDRAAPTVPRRARWASRGACDGQVALRHWALASSGWERRCGWRATRCRRPPSWREPHRLAVDVAGVRMLRVHVGATRAPSHRGSRRSPIAHRGRPDGARGRP